MDPHRPKPASTPRYKRILSLDGGGCWALIEACALGALYGQDTPGRQILSGFDLVIANSGGSLVVGALVAGETPRKIFHDLFLDEKSRRMIFADKWSAFVTREIGLGPRYKTWAKLEGLRTIVNALSPELADTPLDRLATVTHCRLPDFVFTTFDYDRQRAVYLRSFTGSLASSDPVGGAPKIPHPPTPDSTPPKTLHSMTLAEAMHASTNAPVNYFDRPAVFRSRGYAHRRFWDGGVAGLNNPVLAGVIEAIANGSDPAALEVVSIGTASVMLPIDDGTVHPPLAIAPSRSWVVPDIKKLAKAIIDDPPDAASYIAFRILHGDAQSGPRLIRLNPLIQPIRDIRGRWTYPPTLDESYPKASGRKTAFEQLVKMDTDATGQREIELIKRLCDLWIAGDVPNQPVQSGDDLSCRIGHRTFDEAKAAVNSLPARAPAAPPSTPAAA